MDKLLDIEGVAQTLGLGRTVTSRLVLSPKFPDLVIVDGGQGARWSEREVQAYRDGHRAVPEPVPVGVIEPARGAAPHELPAGARRLLKAVEPPWRAWKVTRSKGCPPDRYGRPTEPVVSVAVWLFAPVLGASGASNRRAVALYENGRFRVGYLSDAAGLRKMGATELVNLVRGASG